VTNIKEVDVFNPKQFREIIRDTLKELVVYSGIDALYSEDAVELLMLTSAKETHLGDYLYQLNNGPAKGVFQIEPNTLKDLKDNYLKYNPRLEQAIKIFDTPLPDEDDLTGNLFYQIVIARLIYYRVRYPLPSCKDIQAMAQYYKLYWNTVKGKATVEEAMNSYRHYVLGVKI